MTAPSLYQMEKAKRGIVIPKATGCPRYGSPPPSEVKRRRPSPIRQEQMDRRNEELVAWYREGMSLARVARRSQLRHGKYARTNIGSLWRLLRGLGVEMRKPGTNNAVKVLKQQVAVLRKRLMMYDPQFVQSLYDEEEAA